MPRPPALVGLCPWTCFLSSCRAARCSPAPAVPLGAHLPAVDLPAQPLGSGLVLPAPFFAAVSFLTEPWLSGLERPYSQLTAVTSFAGVLLHALSRLRPRRTPSPGTT